jgi:Fur family transcriptional regulator, ferric uptake regulator
MSHENIDYVKRLRSKGYRITLQRLIVLDAVCEVGGHATFGQIHQRVKFADPTISKSTVYRALDILSEVGLVAETEIGNEGKVYIITGGASHHHLVCSSCGTVSMFDVRLLDPVIDLILDKHNFQVHADHLVLSGLCENCRGSNQHLS